MRSARTHHGPLAGVLSAEANGVRAVVPALLLAPVPAVAHAIAAGGAHAALRRRGAADVLPGASLAQNRRLGGVGVEPAVAFRPSAVHRQSLASLPPCTAGSAEALSGGRGARRNGQHVGLLALAKDAVADIQRGCGEGREDRGRSLRGLQVWVSITVSESVPREAVESHGCQRSSGITRPATDVQPRVRSQSAC